jgi:hypothetical protein
VIRQSEIFDLNIWSMAVHRPLPPSCTVLDNSLADVTVAYESGWNECAEMFCLKIEWPEAGLIALLVNDGAHFHAFRKLMLSWFDRPILILYRELYTIVMSIPVFSSAPQHRRFPFLRKALSSSNFPNNSFGRKSPVNTKYSAHGGQRLPQKHRMR